MTDKKFLEWVYNRLHYQYGANWDTDWMIRFAHIIEAMDDRRTPPKAHVRTGVEIDGKGNV